MAITAGANNAKTAGDILVWLKPEFNTGTDTAVVFSYTCPVDSHRVVSAVKLGYDSGGTLVDTTPVCPIHDATLTGWKVVTVD